MAKWEIEYAEAYRQFRQIDTQIWGIYALYVTVLVAAGGLLAKAWPPSTANYVMCLAGLGLVAAVTMAQFALVGHLQWYSDLLADRIRQIERLNGISVAGIFCDPDEAAARLWGPHRWLMRWRARDVMQILGLLSLALCITGAVVIALWAAGYIWGEETTTDAVIAICATAVLISAVCGAVIVTLARLRLEQTALRLGTPLGGLPTGQLRQLDGVDHGPRATEAHVDDQGDNVCAHERHQTQAAALTAMATRDHAEAVFLKYITGLIAVHAAVFALFQLKTEKNLDASGIEFWSTLPFLSSLLCFLGISKSWRGYNRAAADDGVDKSRSTWWLRTVTAISPFWIASVMAVALTLFWFGVLAMSLFDVPTVVRGVIPMVLATCAAMASGVLSWQDNKE